jgi:murein hydrolase activator
MKYIIYIIIIIILFSGITYSGVYNMRDDIHKQINYLKYDISLINAEFSNNELKLSEYEQKVNEIENEIVKISELLNSVDNKNLDSGNLAVMDEADVIKYNYKLEAVKNLLKQKMIWLYKHGANYNLEMLFTIKNFNDFYIRITYLQKVSKSRKNDIDKIKKFKYLILEKKKLMDLNKTQKLIYINNKKEEERTLTENKIYFDENIKELKRFNENIQRLINLKNKLIENLEAILKENTANFTFNINQNANYDSDNFPELKRKLIYPVASNFLLQDFGINVNNVLSTNTYNNGIDISICKNSDVKCVANGTIEEISELPYFGNIIIVKHSANYRTLYSVVNDILVKPGQEIKAGDILARSSENEAGQFLHFEIWNGNTPLDPKEWLQD